MKKISFSRHVLPHLIAIIVFQVVTVLFFSPVFFDNKKIEQHDIQQWEGSAKELQEYREETGEEGLWANSMFSGMPAYLVDVSWGNKAVGYVKKLLVLYFPHPVSNIYAAVVCYYIMLLVFGVRPYYAIAGALAFGYSSYMIVGIIAGHNARIAAVAFMPLVMAGIHLAFSGKRLLGFAVTTAGLALHLRENHLQITYYMIIIVAVYGLVQMIYFLREKRTAEFFRTLGLLVPAALIAAGTFFGPMWAVSEYSAYSTRGQSELVSANAGKAADTGVGKEYAFEFSNGLMEPFTLLIPNIYGGSSSDFLVMNQESETYKALARSGDQQMANQLANYTGAYWGPQRLAIPYYAGAIVVFLFVVGIVFAERKYIWWLVPISILAIMLSLGSNAAWFNYFVFDYLPGYNKFRSVPFALVIVLFAMPLLGMLGLEKVATTGATKDVKRGLLIAFGVVGGLCLLILLSMGAFSFAREIEITSQLPSWFLDALMDDRKALLQKDAFRSLLFIVPVFVFLYFGLFRNLHPAVFYALLTILIISDLASVDKRYLKTESFKRKREISFFTITEADQEILKDKSYYRVYNLQDPNPLAEARTSYYHNSLGGYHGAKLERYQDLFDSCLLRETNELIQDARGGQLNFSAYGVLNMLNAKYIVYGPARGNLFRNTAANGNAWFVSEVVTAQSPADELAKTCSIDTRRTAVIDGSKFQVPQASADSAATIRLIEQKPNYLKYESQSSQNALAVFSEIYYEKGWKAFIDGNPADILRANYVLRALSIPAGKHTVEFRFEPAAYTVGNTVTRISTGLMILILIGSIAWSFREPKGKEAGA